MNATWKDMNGNWKEMTGKWKETNAKWKEMNAKCTEMDGKKQTYSVCYGIDSFVSYDLFTRNWFQGMHIEYSTALRTHTHIYLHGSLPAPLPMHNFDGYVHKQSKYRRHLATFF